MKKKFTFLIAALALLVFMTPSMAGWGQTYEWVETPFSELTTDDVFVIVGTTDNGSNYYALSQTLSSSHIVATPVTISNGKITSETINDNIKWKRVTVDGGYRFQTFSNSNSYLCNKKTSGNDPDVTNLSIGTIGSVGNIFSQTTYNNSNMLNCNVSSRYLCIYSSSSWRAYKNNNIIDTPTTFYKKVSSSGGDPSFSADPTTLSPFTYVEGNGPSAAQTISVSGSNLIDPINLTLGNSSDYEISTSQNSGYNYYVDLNPDNNGTVSATNVYVRLKSGLAKGTHNGTLTIQPSDPAEIEISLSGSVTGQAHAVTVATGLTGGTIGADPTSAVEGATISLTANPEDAYTFAYWSVYKTGDQTTTVTVSNNQFTMPDYAVTVSATFTAKPTHTATFSVNGSNTSNSFYEGQAIQFPANPAAISGKSFVGWSETTISGTTNTAPTLVTSATMGNNDVTYYAVFADVTGTTEASWTATELGSLTSSDIFVIVGNNGSNYAMKNTDASNTGPAAISVTVSGNELSGTVPDNIRWNISGNATDGYIFYPNGSTTTWLYCTNNNNGLRIGSGNTDYNTFEIKDSYIYNTGRGRYVGIYNSTDWRSYTSSGGNIANQTFAFYKYTAGSSIYANYCTSVVVTYSVTYDGNGATSGSVPEDNTAYTSGQSVTVAGNTGNLAKTGYAFGGWNTQNDGQGTNYAANETFSITANTTLYAKWNEKTITGLSYTGTPTKTTYSAGESFDPTGLTVTATYNDASQENVTASVTWTPDPLTLGTTSVTGTYMGQTVNVSGITVNAAAGSEENPYTVAQAISNTPSSGTLSDVYIHGIVSAFYNTSITGDGTNYRFYISDDGTTSNQLLVYKGKGLGNVAFSNIDDLRIGDILTIKGGLTMYNEAPEVAKDNYIVSQKLVAPTFSVEAGGVTSGTTVAITDLHTTNTTIYYTTDGSTPTTSSSVYSTPITITTATTINAIAAKTGGYTTSNVATAEYTILVTPTITVTADNPINVSAAAVSGELALTYENFTITQVSDFDVQFYDANDQAISSQNKPTWITVNVATATPSGYKVTYSVQANDGAARSAYFKVDALDDNTELVYSNKVTVTQAAADYATLPFEYTDTDVNEDLSLNNMPNGLTQEGLGTYSGSTPRLKFDTQDDYLVLKLNTPPVQISYDIKGNTFSNGTFTVQLSANGEDYEDLAEYTTLGGTTQKITHICNNSSVRYIKWIYTKRTTGNVALGNIYVTADAIDGNNLTINTGETLTVSDGAILTLTGTVTNNGTIVIEDGGQLVTKISGIKATVKKNVTAAANWGTTGDSYTPDGWYFIASPVNGAAFPTGTVDNQDIYQLDWTNNKWLNIQNGHSSLLSDGFQRGTGYLYASKDGNTISVAGEIQPLSDSDNATITLTTTGWHLIGNPLTCKVTVDKAFSELNNGSTVTNKDANSVINPYQGIAVYKKTEGSETVTFTKAESQNAAAPSNNSSLQMTLAKKVTSRGEVSTKVVDNAVVSFNNSKGMPKFNMLGGNAKLYIPQNNEEYAVVFSDRQGDMPLNFKADELGTYTINFETSDRTSLQGIYLIDMLEEQEIDLSVEPSYTFIGSPADRAARFKIVFRTGFENSPNNIFAYQNGSDIVVCGEGELQIFDVMGRMVATQRISGVETINVKSQGVYIMKLNEKTQKIVVR